MTNEQQLDENAVAAENTINEGSGINRQNMDNGAPNGATTVNRLDVEQEVCAPLQTIDALHKAKAATLNEYSTLYDKGLAKIVSGLHVFNGTTYINGENYVKKDKDAFLAKMSMQIDQQSLEMERMYVAQAYASIIPDENGNYAQPDSTTVGFVKSYNVLTQKMTEEELHELLYRVDAFAQASNSLSNDSGGNYKEAERELDRRKDERVLDYENAIARRYSIAYKMDDGTFFEGSEQDLSDLLYCEALQLDFKSLAGLSKATQIMTAAKFLSQEKQIQIKDAINRQLRFAIEATPEQQATADAKKSFVKGKLRELGRNPDDSDNASLFSELLLGLDGSIRRADWDGYVEAMVRTDNIRKKNALTKEDFSARIAGIGFKAGAVDPAYEFDSSEIGSSRPVHSVEGWLKRTGSNIVAHTRVELSRFARAKNWLKENVLGYIVERDEDGSSE